MFNPVLIGIVSCVPLLHILSFCHEVEIIQNNYALLVKQKHIDIFLNLMCNIL